MMEQSNPESVSVILLVHNEAAIIEHVVKEFHSKIIAKIPHSELIIVEDGSTDGTQDVLDLLQNELKDLKIFQKRERLGYVGALKQAISMTHNKLWLFCDSSGKHDPDDFWKMLPLIQKHDLVVGVKKQRQDPLYRVMISKVFNWFINFYFGTQFADINCPLRLVRSQVFHPLLEQQWIQTELINFELTLRMKAMGAKICEVPVSHFKRINGKSRGLPLKKIPHVILQTFKNAPQLKKQLQLLAEK